MKSSKNSQKGQVDILDTILRKFSYLEHEYGFKIVKKKRNNDFEILYTNETTGVLIIFDRRENQIFVMVYQLENGVFRENPIFINHDTKIYGYDLEDILSSRISRYSGTKRSVDFNGVLDELDNYAKMLKFYASDLLLGDFQLFPKVEKIVKSR